MTIVFGTESDKELVKQNFNSRYQDGKFPIETPARVKFTLTLKVISFHFLPSAVRGKNGADVFNHTLFKLKKNYRYTLSIKIDTCLQINSFCVLLYIIKCLSLECKTTFKNSHIDNIISDCVKNHHCLTSRKSLPSCPWTQNLKVLLEDENFKRIWTIILPTNWFLLKIKISLHSMCPC